MADYLKEEVINLKGDDFMDIKYCVKCSSHYMNGDDYWCNHYDNYCEDINDGCEWFEEFEERS